MDKCCGRAGTHEELKQFYELPMPYTPTRGSFQRVPSTEMTDEDIPFGEKQVQAHGWIHVLKITDEVQNLIRNDQDYYFEKKTENKMEVINEIHR